MKCPCCGGEFPEEPAFNEQTGWEMDLSTHIYREHMDPPYCGCWCGPRTNYQGLRAHMLDNGGYEAHWMDYLMGVSNANQPG